MKNKPYIILVALTIGFVTTCYAQPAIYLIKNGFGITAGVTQYDIITDNFTTKSGTGWLAGMSATVDLPHKWFTISYGMQLSDNNFEIYGRTPDGGGNEMIKYNLKIVQVGLTYYIKLKEDNLTFDLGPQVQYNGKLELKDGTKENYLINGYDAVTAADITDISQFNVNGLVGASGGMGPFKIKAQYIYSFTNILNKLNDNNIDTGDSANKFKGNQSMIVVAFMFTF